MFSLSSLVQKAQALIDPAVPTSSIGDQSARAALFRQQFRLPDSQSPLQDILVELILPAANPAGAHREGPGRGNRYAGRLHLSEGFLCFSTQTTSFLPSANGPIGTEPAHGAGPTGNGFTWPLCVFRRVERLHSQNNMFTLGLTPWNGRDHTKSAGGGELGDGGRARRLTVRLAGSRQACERFCDGLKKGLRERVRDLDKMREVVAQCYSEYLMSTTADRVAQASAQEARKSEPPDAGLGMLFRYPGDAKKLRDRSKMRLWSEYFRGGRDPARSVRGRSR